MGGYSTDTAFAAVPSNLRKSATICDADLICFAAWPFARSGKYFGLGKRMLAIFPHAVIPRKSGNSIFW